MPDYGYSKDALRAIVGLSGEFVGTTDAQIETNKTIVLEDNVIKSTTPAAGDIPVSNGTKFIKLARGTAGQPIKVNAGATDIEYGTLPVIGGGTGAVTLTGILKGAGTTAITTVAAPTGALLGDSDTQNISGKKTFFDSALGYRNAANTATLTVRSPAITTDGDFIFNSPYTYHVFADSNDSYIVKARFGVGEYIRFSNVDPATTMQACINALTTTGGIIFIKQGTFTTATKITIPAATHGVVIVFENPYTTWTYTGTDAAFEVGGTGTQTVGFELRNGRITCSSTTGSPVGLRLKNLNHARLYNPRINGDATTTGAIGIELNGGANFNGDIHMFAPYIHNVKIGIKTTNGAANAIGIFGGYIGGNAGPVAGSYGIDKDGGDTWQVRGLDIESMETAIREQAIDVPYGSSEFDVRTELCTNYVTTATSYNIFSGSTTTTIITDTGLQNDFTAPNIEIYNRPKTYSTTVVKKSDTSAPLTVYRPISATGNYVGTNYDLWNASSAQYTAGAIRAVSAVNTAGAERTSLNFYHKVAGAEVAGMQLSISGTLLGGPNLRLVLAETGLTNFRTFTFPDQTSLVAGQNFANVFSVIQKFDLAADLKAITIPADPAAGYVRAYPKAIDANNDGLFIKRKLNGAVVEVQIG